MKAIRILFALLIAFAVSPATAVFAAEKNVDDYFIDDVDYDHSAYEELERFVNADIIDGYKETEVFEEDGEIYEYTAVLLKPENSITRAQFTKILVNAMNLTAGENAKTFSDVKASDWYYEYVQIASSRGIITGKEDGTFKPNDKITRAQMAVMIHRAFSPTVDFSATGKTFKDVQPGNFAYEAVVKTEAVGIIKGYGDHFKPNDFARRSHAVLMIDRALHKEPGTAEDEIAILHTVDRNVVEDLLYTEQANVEAMEALYRETATGYYLAYSLDSLSLLDDPEYADVSTKMTQVGEHRSHVVSLNKRFAEVRVDDLTVQVSMNEPGFPFDTTLDLSGTAYLKKMADGSWKIYNLVMDEDMLDETLEDY